MPRALFNEPSFLEFRLRQKQERSASAHLAKWHADAGEGDQRMPVLRSLQGLVPLSHLREAQAIWSALLGIHPTPVGQGARHLPRE